VARHLRRWRSRDGTSTAGPAIEAHNGLVAGHDGSRSSSRQLPELEPAGPDHVPQLARTVPPVLYRWSGARAAQPCGNAQQGAVRVTGRSPATGPQPRGAVVAAAGQMSPAG